jgi:hypothetical protein
MINIYSDDGDHNQFIYLRAISENVNVSCQIQNLSRCTLTRKKDKKKNNKLDNNQIELIKRDNLI